MVFLSIFFFNDTATTEIYTLSLHDALPIFIFVCPRRPAFGCERHQSRGSSSSEPQFVPGCAVRSEEHTSELQSRLHLVCRLLLEKKNQRTSTPLPLAYHT